MEWREVSWLPNYQISEFGDCRRVKVRQKHGVYRRLRGTLDREGYRKFKLTMPDGSKLYRYAHRLCCEAFWGPPTESDLHTAHWDGNKLNNYYRNLRWATPLENGADRARHAEERRRAKSQQYPMV
jgi:hypothetical protein